MKYWLLVVTLIVLCTTNASGQSSSRYITGKPLATFGVKVTNGFLYVSLPLVDTTIYGTVDTVQKLFLIDPRASNDGSYLPEDSNTTHLGQREYTVVLPTGNSFPLHLAASLAKWNFRKADTTFVGTIGYGFLRQYITVLDLIDNTITFYPLQSKVTYSKRLDHEALSVPYYDDAMVSYCHCSYPTIWLDPDVSPLIKGRMHFSLADRQSVLYRNALPESIKKKIDDAAIKDSIEGKPPSLSGVTLTRFVLGTEDIVKADPRRPIDKMPDFFKDMNFTVTGTVAFDVVRKYKGLIIDPSRSVLLFCKY